MADKQVTIDIASGDLETLKNNGYQLCFAKKVNDTYNVVWRASSEYLGSNTFSWTPAYQLFGTNTFQAGVKVTAETNTQNISLGQQCVLDSAGELQPPTSGPAGVLTLVNQYGPIHPGVNEVSTGIDGRQMATSIYVSQEQIISGTDTLTPVEMVMVWFEQDISTGTMFSNAVSLSQEIDMTQQDKVTYSFQDFSWKLGPLSNASQAESEEGSQLLNIRVKATAAISASQLAQRISARLTGVYQDIQVTVNPVTVNPSTGKFTITYSERLGIGLERAVYLHSLKQSPALLDTLLEFTVEALASLNSAFTSLEASTDQAEARVLRAA